MRRYGLPRLAFSGRAEIQMGKQANSFTRRRFLETTIAGSIPIVFSGGSNLPINATSQETCSSPFLGWDQRRLSHAVLHHVGRELGQVYNVLQSRRAARANDVRSVMVNMRLLFTHLHEIRLIQVLEQKINECPQKILDFAPQHEHLTAMRDALASVGVNVSLDQLRQGLTIPYEDRIEVLSRVRRFGILRFVKRGLGALNAVAKKLDRQTSEMMDANSLTNLLADCDPPPCADIRICICGVDCPPEDEEICREAALQEACQALRELNLINAVIAAAATLAGFFFSPFFLIAAEFGLAAAIGEYFYYQYCER